MAGMDRDTESADESSFWPPLCNTKDWRPAFDQKMQGMLCSFGALWDPEKDADVLRMAESSHECRLSSQERNNTVQIGKGFYMKAASPGVNFDASALELARKQRIETLQHVSGCSRNFKPLVQEDNVASTRLQKESEERRLDEVRLLRNYVAPRRERTRWTSETVNSNENLTQPADQAQLLLTTGEVHLKSPGPDSSHTVPSIAAMILAERGGRSPRQNGVSGWVAGYSDASTVRSASNTAIWRCHDKYDDSADGERQGNKGGGSLIDSAGTLSEPEEPERRDSALAGLEETQGHMAGEKDEAKSSAADCTSGRRLCPTKKRNREEENTQRQLEHGEPASESVVLEPRTLTRALTTVEKGKWVAECECPLCLQQRHKRIRFTGSEMNKADQVPGLSRFAETMREYRQRMEAHERGEGVSSWAATGSADLVAGLDIFENPRPAPPVPVRGQDSVNVMLDGTSRPPIWRALSRRFKR